MEHLGPSLRRRRRREHPLVRAAVALLISLGLNLLLWTVLDARWLGVGKVEPLREVALAPLAASEWEANRQVRPQPAAPRPIELPAPRPDQLSGQVVDVGDQPTRSDEPPKEARFLSDRNRTVEKETVARVRKAPGERTTPVTTGPLAAQQAGQVGQVAPPGGEPGPKGPRGAEPPRPEAAPAPAPVTGQGPGDLAVQAQRPPPQGGGDGADRAGKGDPRLAIAPQTLARLAGGASHDHLAGMEEGDGTFLNTREWKYASYFNRIKEQVSGTWNPRRALDQRDPDRSIYAFKDRYTLLSVTLDDKGAVKDLLVSKSSNVDFLDVTAMEAFRRAQPFANPPSGLADAHGEIRFTFGFYLEVGRTGMRIYRGPAPF